MKNDPHDRLRRTATFRSGAHESWCNNRIGVFGVGLIGSRFCVEAVRSGGRVWACDPEPVEPENLGTQSLHAGMGKVESVIRACDEIAPGRCTGVARDGRCVGISRLRSLDLLVDCTDDPGLAPFLTEVSNGLGKPLLRLAVDGSGERELGRVLASHGGAGRSCQLCPCSARDLGRLQHRMGCRDNPSTLAGGAIGAVIAGAGLLQAQRLIGGNDRDLVLDREVIIDLGDLQMHPMKLNRSENCVSRHRRWSFLDVEGNPGESTPADLFELAEKVVGPPVALEPYAHPLSLEAFCDCGRRQLDIASVLAPGPRCSGCGRITRRRRDAVWPRFGREEAQELGILGTPLRRLGLPAGAMVLGHSEVRDPVRLLLGDPEDVNRGESRRIGGTHR